jgi:hypothetical protein
VAHRVTSPLLFGIRDKGNGFSSQSEEMKTAFSILQTMTIAPFQNIILNALDYALSEGGYNNLELYFDQLTPLVILSETAEETGQTIEEVQQDTNESMENPATVEEDSDATIDDGGVDTDTEVTSTPQAFVKPTFFEQEYEIIKQK